MGTQSIAKSEMIVPQEVERVEVIDVSRAGKRWKAIEYT